MQKITTKMKRAELVCLRIPKHWSHYRN